LKEENLESSDLLEYPMRSQSLIKLVSFAATVVLFCSMVAPLHAQTSDAQTTEPQSWSKTTESHPANMNPTRTTESHKDSAKGTVDSQSVERLGADGHYEPYYDVERESVQVNGTTVRTIERTFARDGSGQKVLTSVTEEEKQTLPAGGEKSVRTISNTDLNGRLQVAQREVTDTKTVSPEVKEKNTTVFLSDGQGSMTPSMQIQQRETRGGDHSIAVQTSTLLPDGSGKWQVHERKESTIKEDGPERTTDEQVLRQGPDGKLAPVSRTVGKESETAGKKKSTIETYSPDASGSADANLRLSQRVIVVKQAGPNGAQTTERRVEQSDQVNPGRGLQMTTKTLVTVQPGASGTRETSTVEARDVGGDFTVVSFDTEKSDNVHAVDVEIAPPKAEVPQQKTETPPQKKDK
jgi:hypothetical protein